MASHDLSNTKTTILGATPGAIPGIDGNAHEIFSFTPSILGAYRLRTFSPMFARFRPFSHFFARFRTFWLSVSDRFWPSAFALFLTIRVLPFSGCHLDPPDVSKTAPTASKGTSPLKNQRFCQAKTPWVAPACADCPGFLVWVLLLPRPPPSARSLRLCPCASILLHGPLDICLDLLPATPPPPVQNRDAQD